MEWQTIETAPKDGTEVLISSKNGIKVARYEPWAWSDKTRDAFQWFIALQEGNGGGTYAVDPTHWMPLPLPPH